MPSGRFTKRAAGWAVVLCAIAALLSVRSLRARSVDAGATLQSIGAIAFAPDGVLIAADPSAQALVAISLPPEPRGAQPSATSGVVDVDEISRKVAALLGTGVEAVTLVDLAVHPLLHSAYLSVIRGHGARARPVVVRVGASGELEVVNLANATMTSVAFPSSRGTDPAGRGNRLLTVTDAAVSDGRVFVAGVSNEESAGGLWSVAYPFAPESSMTVADVLVANRKQARMRAALLSLLPLPIGGQPQLLAGCLCSSLLTVSVADVVAGRSVLGSVRLEMGVSNVPVDIVAYERDGQTFFLMSTGARTLLKMSDFRTVRSGLEAPTGAPVATGEAIAAMNGIEQLDLLDGARGVAIVRDPAGARRLTTFPLP